MAVDQTRFLLSDGLVLGDRYCVGSPISSGAMGAVYRARDTRDDRGVAVKHLLDARHAERFEVESRLLAVLSHPRVVKVLDYFCGENGQYLVMELVEGIDLDVLLTQRGAGLPIDEAIGYIRQGCEALQYVHEQQIVHRDVKPQNLIVGDHGIVLVDFGIARMLGEDTFTATTGIGTPRYMSPEVFAGGAVSPRSDVFSIAATLWTLLTGTPPVYASPTRLSELRPDVPPELEAAVLAGLEMIPERRVASVDAFARAIGGGSLQHTEGRSLVSSVERPAARRTLLEAIVRTAAGVFEAAAASIALTDGTTGELVYQAAFGAGSDEIVGVRLPPGQGLAGVVLESGQPLAVGDCRNDPRFAARIAAGTGYVPYTMLVVPLLQEGHAIGTLSLLDRRDGGRYGPVDAERAAMFAELTVAAIEADVDAMPRLGASAPTQIRPPRS